MDDSNQTPTTDADEAQVIHLPTVIPPVRQLLAFYDELLKGTQPSITLLDEAVIELKALPDIPGRLGRDIALIADGGKGASRADVVGSLERLRQVAAMDPQPVTRTVTTRTRKPKANATPQATLPGMN